MTQATLEQIKKLKPGDKIKVKFPKNQSLTVKFVGFYNPVNPNETKLNRTFSFAEIETETGEMKKIFSLSQIAEIL